RKGGWPLLREAPAAPLRGLGQDRRESPIALARVSAPLVPPPTRAGPSRAETTAARRLYSIPALGYGGMNDALPLVGGRSRPARGRRPPGLRLAPDRCRTLPGRLGGRQHIAEGRRAGLSRALGAGAPGEGQRLRSQIGPEK